MTSQEQAMEHVPPMSYLDDPNHLWEIDPDCTASIMESIEHLSKHGSAEAVLFVLKGYEELRKRQPDASRSQCLATSMMWWFG